MNYKISIIIPIYNIERYLTKTLDSLLNQTIGHENLEIIMIDDCSDDGSVEIIDDYANKYENFIVIHLPENSGLPGKPRNVGIERATGDYLMFMDHDDCYVNDACEVLYNKITEENVDIVFSRYNYFFEDGKVQHSFNYCGEISEIKINSIDEDKQLLTTAPSIWTKIFKRNLIIDNKIRFPEGVLAEDLFFVVKSLLMANGIVYLNNYFSYNYRIRDSEKDKSTIRIKNKKYLMAMINGYFDTYKMLEELDHEKYFSIFFKEHAQYWMNCFILSNTSISEKKELLSNVSFLFEKEKEQNVDLDMNYIPLFNDIVDKKFDKAILFSDIMADFKLKEINLEDKYRKLQKNYQENNQKIIKLQKQLDSRKKQLAELQTVSGWLNYKVKNIFTRIKSHI
jgi:glycosyltransferase involved in cell wall biosynthesis